MLADHRGVPRNDVVLRLGLRYGGLRGLYPCGL